MVFSYHVLRPLYMTDLNRFIEWTARHNETQDYLRFRVENIDAFARLLTDVLTTDWGSVWNKSGKVLEQLDATGFLSKTACLSHPI